MYVHYHICSLKVIITSTSWKRYMGEHYLVVHTSCIKANRVFSQISDIQNLDIRKPKKKVSKLLKCCLPETG